MNCPKITCSFLFSFRSPSLRLWICGQPALHGTPRPRLFASNVGEGEVVPGWISAVTLRQLCQLNISQHHHNPSQPPPKVVPDLRFLFCTGAHQGDSVPWMTVKWQFSTAFAKFDENEPSTSIDYVSFVHKDASGLKSNLSWVICTWCFSVFLTIDEQHDVFTFVCFKHWKNSSHLNSKASQVSRLFNLRLVGESRFSTPRIKIA